MRTLIELFLLSLVITVLSMCTVVGCGDERTDIPDADIGCCVFLPDEDGARSCASASLPPGTCGVLACQRPEGGFQRINFCGPME